jgi:hypothetical protein
MSKSGKSSGSGSQSHTQYRSAKDGQFKTEKQAERMKPENVVKERVPNPGYGDTGRGKKK